MSQGSISGALIFVNKDESGNTTRELDTSHGNKLQNSAKVVGLVLRFPEMTKIKETHILKM
jgi:hypothetical protein